LRYRVDIKAAAPAGLGDRSGTYDATETSRGEVFPTEITAGARRAPLARLIATLRAAGY
jgi:hypothetical protein